MFQFSKKRIAEIEDLCARAVQMEKQFQAQRVTRLNNEGAGQSQGSIQRELLQGRYRMNIDKKMAYRAKMTRIAEEPIAYHLYKRRHFEKFKKESDVKIDPDDPFPDGDEVAKEFKKQLLRLANAQIIGRIKFNQIVEETSNLGQPLDNYILNLSKGD